MPPKMRIPDIISQVYSKRYKFNKDKSFKQRSYMRTPVHYPLGQYKPSRRHQTLEKIKEVLKNHYVISFICAAFIIKSIFAIYYYNLLISAEQNMKASYSDMSALMQRRNDIAANLSKTVLDYSKYEEAVFTSIVGLRTLAGANAGIDSTTMSKLAPAMPEPSPTSLATAQPAPDPAMLSAGKDILASMSKLMAVAEQYPDLKLSTNFATLMTALVEVEKDLANQRIKFNAEANVYTTYIYTFPLNVFAWVFNFEDFSYFEATEEAKSFRLINY